jgi:large subunit ribosomal protein L15
MLSLSNLKPKPGSRKKRKRIGRGEGSGSGKTSGKGQKGQKARSGGAPHPWFEGGQMPLQRRVPKRGFHNLFKKMFDVVNVEALQKAAGTQPITPEVMREKGWIRTGDKAVKVLGNGELKKAITVHAHHFSQTAKDKIEKAGGQAIVIK